MKNQLFQGEYVASERLLYTASEFAKNNLFYLQEIGSLTAQKAHTSKRQNLSSFLVFFVNSGSGVLDYQKKEYEVSAGDCVFINCQNPYSHRTSSNLWSLNWIHFYGNGVLPIYLKYIERGGQPVFHPDRPESFLDIYSALNSVAHSTDYIRDIRINEHLAALITFIMSFSWNPDEAGKKRSSQTSFTVREYIDSHYMNRITLDDLADRFFTNKYSLSRSFKAQFGTSVINYLLTVRITHAKQMLRFTDKTVEEIGALCGISPLYYFSRIFKQIEGVSPMEYRLQWR